MYTYIIFLISAIMLKSQSDYCRWRWKHTIKAPFHLNTEVIAFVTDGHGLSWLLTVTGDVTDYTVTNNPMKNQMCTVPILNILFTLIILGNTFYGILEEIV